MTPEQIELQRQAYARVIANHASGARKADPDTLATALVFVAAHPPLDRPLGDGAPLDPRLQHLESF